MKGKNTLSLALFALAVVGLFALGACSTAKSVAQPSPRKEAKGEVVSSVVMLPPSDAAIAYGEVDVARMSRELGISKRTAAEAFGVPYHDDEEGIASSATTFEEWQSVYWDTLKGSEERKAVLAKMSELAKTFAEWQFVYWRTPEGSAEQKAVLAKMSELAKTLEEWQSVYWDTPEGSAEQKAAIRKLATFFPKQK